MPSAAKRATSVQPNFARTGCGQAQDNLALRLEERITRAAFGFKSPEPLIALAMLNLGGHQPPFLPAVMT